ncbi:hypothetical protein LLEC1_00094, partial [Akanthomyces lecanii]
MNPPYQPPGPQQAFPNSMPPPEGPPNYQRSAPSQLQLPAPRQLLQYADSYRHATSQSPQSQPQLQHLSTNLPPPHQTIAPPAPQPQHYQPPHHQQQQQHQLPAINHSHASRRESYADETTLPPANSSSSDAKPAQALLTAVSDVDLVDRRPITPPPCVRLSIIDIATGKEINYNEIDHAMFVLNVDLWNAEGTREVNLVRSSAAPSSAALPSTNVPGFAPRNVTEAPHGPNLLPLGREALYSQQRPPLNPSEYAGHASYHNGNNVYRAGDNYALPSQHRPQHHGYGTDQPIPPQSDSGHSGAASASDGYGQEPGAMPRMSVSGGQPQGMFTRNLIGSVAVSAFNLCDTEDTRGIWFVLQDLSVRTEGNFRRASLRFSFVNVGPRGGRVPQDGNPAKVTTGRAPILASAHSEVFSVFSAKKFPG